MGKLHTVEILHWRMRLCEQGMGEEMTRYMCFHCNGIFESMADFNQHTCFTPKKENRNMDIYEKIEKLAEELYEQFDTESEDYDWDELTDSRMEITSVKRPLFTRLFVPWAQGRDREAVAMHPVEIEGLMFRFGKFDYEGNYSLQPDTPCIVEREI